MVVSADQVEVRDYQQARVIDTRTGVVLRADAGGADAAQALEGGWSASRRKVTGPHGEKVEGSIVGVVRVGDDWWVATRETLQRFGSKPEKRAYDTIRALGAMPEGVAWIDADGLHAGACVVPMEVQGAWIAASARWVVVSGKPGIVVVDRSTCTVVAARGGPASQVAIVGDTAWSWDLTSLRRLALPSLAAEPAFTPLAVPKDLGGVSIRGRTVLAPTPWALPGPAWWLGDRFVGLDGGRLRAWSGEGKLLADVDGLGLVAIAGADRSGDRVVVTDGARVVLLGAGGAPTVWTRERTVTRVRATEAGAWIEERQLEGGAWASRTVQLGTTDVMGASEPPAGVAVVAPVGEVRALPSRADMAAGRSAWGLPVAIGSLRCASIPSTVGADQFDWTFERPTLLTAALPYPERLPAGIDVLVTRPAPARELPTLVVGKATTAAVTAACGAAIGDETLLVEPGGAARRFRSVDDAVLAFLAAQQGWAAESFPPVARGVPLDGPPTRVSVLDGTALIVATKGGSARVDLDGVRWRVPGEVREVAGGLVLPLGYGAVALDTATGKVTGPAPRPDETEPAAWSWVCATTCVGPMPAGTATAIGDAEWLAYDGQLVIRKGRRSLLHLDGVDAVLPIGGDRLAVRVGSRFAPWQIRDARGATVAVLPAGELVITMSAVWVAEESSLTAFLR